MAGPSECNIGRGDSPAPSVGEQIMLVQEIWRYLAGHQDTCSHHKAQTAHALGFAA